MDMKMRQTDKTDAELLKQAKYEINKGFISGLEAFEVILSKYERLIYFIARRYFSNAEDVMDVSQETAIKIFNGLPNVKIKKDGNLKAWICTVTARTCLDHLRKRRPQTTELTDEITAGQVLPSAEESAVTNERVNEILSAIQKLPEDHRMAIILRDMQSLSYEEIAAALDISIGTVKSRLSRARAGLKKLLSGESS